MRFVTLATATAATFVACETFAQPAPPKPPDVPSKRADEIVPPRVLSETRVDYPAEASGDAEVLIELLVSTAGKAEEVRVVSGDEPFASAAVSAAHSWLFEPALRRGVAVRARIRMQVVFTEPEPEPVPEEAPAPGPPEKPAATPERPPAAAAPAKPKPEQPIEVVVTGARTNAAPRLSRAEVRQLPGAFGDPFRAIEIMPGVTPIASGLPYFFVRGSPPGNVGYFFDDIAVPGLFHVAAGPALIHPAFVEDVRLYSGAYPARYGRFAGGIVTGLAAPPQYRFHGEASIRLVDAGALLELPFDGDRGSAMLAGRYSYTGAVVSLVAPGVEIGYWDYQGRIQHRLTERDTVSVFGFGSHDFLSAEDDDGEIQNIYDVTFHRLDLRYDRVLGSDSALRIATTLGLDNTGAGEEDGVNLSAERVRNRFVFSHRVSPHTQLRAGGDIETALYDIDIETEGDDDDDDEPSPDRLPPELNPRPLPGLPPRFAPEPSNEEAIQALFSSRNEVIAGAWLEWILDLGSGVTLTPGFRLDVYTGDSVTQIAPEPRISARFQISPRVALLHDLGIAHQAPSFAIPVPGLQGAASQGLQRAVQSSAGTEVDLGNHVSGTLTVFQNVLFGGTDALGLFQLQRADSSIEPEVDRVMARTYGLEVFLRRSLSERLGGFLSYTLSRSTRSLSRLHGPASFDRTHVFNLAVAYDLGRAWRAGIRTVVYTGIPGEVAYPEAAEHPPRAPVFYRFDWRLEKRWKLGKDGFWALVFEVLNTTLHEETLEISCYAYGCESESIGPVTIPSIGVEASF
jgi:TonB family protein